MLAWLSGIRCRPAYSQQMPLSLTISCSSKSRLVLPFWYLLTRVVPDKFQNSSKTIVCVCSALKLRMNVRPSWCWWLNWQCCWQTAGRPTSADECRDELVTTASLAPPCETSTDYTHAQAAQHTHTQPFYSLVSRYQKKHSPTHTYRGHHLSASSIYNDPWHPHCSIHVPDSLFPQSLHKFSLVYLLAWHPPLHTPYISSPNHHLFFRNTCPYHRNLFRCSTEIMSSNLSLSLNALLGILCCGFMPGAADRKKIVGAEGVWGWNPHPGRGRSPAGGRILTKAVIGFWMPSNRLRQNLD